MGLSALMTLAALLLVDPIAQDPNYHRFADARTLWEIPNFWNVVSNLPFLWSGFWGLWVLARAPRTPTLTSWRVFFFGVTLVALGSSFYHWNPTSKALVWDRLPMTMGFMGLFVAICCERISSSWRALLWPAVLLGMASVGYWAWRDDLRFYAFVQFFPLLVLAVFLCRPWQEGRSKIPMLGSLLGYLAAKLTEHFDYEIWAVFGEQMSGHAIKHIFAALAGAALVYHVRPRT